MIREERETIDAHFGDSLLSRTAARYSHDSVQRETAGSNSGNKGMGVTSENVAHSFLHEIFLGVRLHQSLPF